MLIHQPRKAGTTRRPDPVEALQPSAQQRATSPPTHSGFEGTLFLKEQISSKTPPKWSNGQQSAWLAAGLITPPFPDTPSWSLECGD